MKHIPVQDHFEAPEEDTLRIPPFADSHMHFTVEGRPAAREELPGILESCGRYGIFALDDMGHKSDIGLKAKEEMPQGMRLRTAGHALFRKGGYGAFLGKGVQGKEEIIGAVEELVDAGADFIKVINSGIVSTKKAGVITEGGFSAEELKMIHEEARQRGLELMCHANSDAAIRRAVRAGASSIEHGFFVSRETLHMMKEAGTAWTPTVYAMWSLVFAAGASEKKYIEKVVDGHLSSLHYAASLGVELRVGTDSGSRGVPHGKSFFEELCFWQKAGLTKELILSSACMDRAEIGKGNYLVAEKDFIATGKIDAVYRDGVRVIP